MICTLTTKDDMPNWCEHHQMQHNGHYTAYSQDPGEKGEKFRKYWDTLRDNPIIRSLPLAKTCVYMGERLTQEEVKEKQLVGCRSCNNVVPAFHCKYPGMKKFNNGPYTRQTECMSCEQWASPVISHQPILQTIQFDRHNLTPEVPEYRFNSSIIESGDGYLFVFRNGWMGSNLYAVRLNKQFQPVSGATLLEVNRQGSSYGREDPRLFRLNGKLHVMFIGVVGRLGPTNVLFARINEETLAVEDRFFPKGFVRQSWEKNFQFFDYQGIAHAVYSINPHKILRIEGNNAEFIHETPFTGAWSGGYMRGGASPVLHNGEWYCFFHGKWDNMRARLPSQPSTDPMRHVYNMGVYTFSPEPPFQVLRYIPNPIAIAEPDLTDGNYADVIFPCGAVLHGDHWAVSMGINDRRSEIRFYDRAWIDSQMKEIA